MITSWGANKYHGLTTTTTWGYHQHKIIVAAKYQQSAEQSQQDTWFTEKNTACGDTASETSGILV